jgi:hypothetical protein
VLENAMKDGLRKRREKGYSMKLEKIEIENMLKESISYQAEETWPLIQMAVLKQMRYLWNEVDSLIYNTVQMDTADFKLSSDIYPAVLMHLGRYESAFKFILWSANNQKRLKNLSFYKVLSSMIFDKQSMDDALERSFDRTEDDLFKLPQRSNDTYDLLTIEDFHIPHLLALALLKLVRCHTDIDYDEITEEELNELWTRQAPMVQNLFKEIDRRNPSVLPAILNPKSLYEKALKIFKADHGKNDQQLELPWKKMSHLAQMVQIYSQLYDYLSGLEHIRELLNFEQLPSYNVDLLE